MAEGMMAKGVWLTLLVTAWWVGGADAQAHGPSAAASTHAEVPLRLDGGRMIVAVGTEDGRSLDFAVSAGNSVLVLTESAAARLGAQPKLSLGDLPVVTDGMQTIPDDGLVTPSGPLAGMIGANTLSQYDVLFDAPGGRMLLAKTGPTVSWPGYTLSEPVRLRVYHGVVLGLDVTVNGTEYMAGLDLGSRSMLVSPPLAATAGLDEEDAVALGLGSTTFPAVPTRTTDHPTFAMWDPAGRGFLYVGSAIVEGCPIAVSWAHRELRTCVR